MTQTTNTVTAREYAARASSTEVFGRVLCDVRDHHYIVDGPTYNDCPGEEVTPGELFLSAVASCGTELVQVIAREDGLPVPTVQVNVHGTVDKARQARAGVTTFTSLRVSFRIGGVSESEAASLVERFQKRCPLYGTVAVAADDVVVELEVEEPRSRPALAASRAP